MLRVRLCHIASKHCLTQRHFHYIAITQVETQVHCYTRRLACEKPCMLSPLSGDVPSMISSSLSSPWGSCPSSCTGEWRWHQLLTDTLCCAVRVCWANADWNRWATCRWQQITSSMLSSAPLESISSFCSRSSSSFCFLSCLAVALPCKGIVSTPGTYWHAYVAAPLHQARATSSLRYLVALGLAHSIDLTSHVSAICNNSLLLISKPSNLLCTVIQCSLPWAYQYLLIVVSHEGLLTHFIIEMRYLAMSPHDGCTLALNLLRMWHFELSKCTQTQCSILLSCICVNNLFCQVLHSVTYVYDCMVAPRKSGATAEGLADLSGLDASPRGVADLYVSPLPLSWCASDCVH